MPRDSARTSEVQAPTAGPEAARRGSEDWNSLDLGANRLPAAPPFLVGKDETDSCVREFIRVQWRRDDPIDLWVLRPVGVTKPPVVLYLYGYPSDTDRYRDNGFCQRATRHGVAAVGFVAALDGHRYHDRPMREWFVSELQEALVKSVHDVQMILDYLATRGDLDMARLGMFGEGSGGSVAILAAAVDARIKALDLLDPWADWPDWMAGSSLVPGAERARYVMSAFLERVAPFDPVQWLPRLNSRAIRIQHVLDGTITPKICKQRLDAVAPPSARVVRFDDGPALLKTVSEGRLFDWIKDEVRPVAIPAAAPKTALPQAKQRLEKE